MKRLSAALLLVAGCFSGPGNDRALKGTLSSNASVVSEFSRLFGTRSFKQFANLFQENVVLEVEGLGIVLTGRAGLRDLAEYGAAVGSRFTATDINEVGDTVRCYLDEMNEWFRLVGVGRVEYEARFTVRRGRIEQAIFRMEPASREMLRLRIAEFVVWLSTNDPTAVEEFLPGGKLKLNRETGIRLLELLKRWRSR